MTRLYTDVLSVRPGDLSDNIAASLQELMDFQRDRPADGEV